MLSFSTPGRFNRRIQVEKLTLHSRSKIYQKLEQPAPRCIDDQNRLEISHVTYNLCDELLLDF